MWDCIECGCRAIAASLTFCPACRKEKGVPKATIAGSSNSWAEEDATPEQVAVAASTSDPAAASAKAREAKAALDAGDHDTALNLLDAAAELHPERADDFEKLKDKVVEAAAEAEKVVEEVAPEVEKAAEEAVPVAEEVAKVAEEVAPVVEGM